MNILVLTPFLPYAGAEAGCPRAVYDRLRLLASAGHCLTVVTFVEPGQSVYLKELTVLGIEVHSAPRDPASQRAGVALWRKRARLALGLVFNTDPLLVQEFNSAPLRRTIAALIRSQAFDLALIEHSLMAQYADALPPALPFVFSEHDPAWVGMRNQKSEIRNQVSGIKYQSSSLIPHPSSFILPPSVLSPPARWRRYVQQACQRATGVLVSTAEDQATLAELVPGLEPQVVPFGMAQLESSSAGSAERETDSLLFVGNFNHPPNVDAAIWLVEEILPLVRQSCPSVQLWLVGKDPPEAVQTLAGPGIIVTGEVPSVQPYLERCTLFVAPLRQGGGMRMKLLEALAAGAPVVTTSVGARGLSATPGQHLLRAESAEDFAASILSALADPALRQALSEQGRQLIGSTQERLDRLSRVLEQAAGPAINSQTFPDTFEPGRVVKEITIVIATLNRPEQLGDCLDSIAAGTVWPAEIIVVDQSGDSHTAAQVEKYRQRGLPLRYIHSERRGLSLSRNLGIKAANTSVIVFTDDDCVVSPGWLEAVERTLVTAGEPEIVAVGGRILPLPTSDPERFPTGVLSRRESRTFRAGPKSVPWDVGFGDNLAFRKAALLEVGLFDERLGVGAAFKAGEDIDLIYRLQLAGKTLCYDPTMLIWHATKTRQKRRQASLDHSFGVGAFCALHWRAGGVRLGWLYIRMQGVRLLGGLRRRNFRQVEQAALSLFGLSAGAFGWLVDKEK